MKKFMIHCNSTNEMAASILLLKAAGLTVYEGFDADVKNLCINWNFDDDMCCVQTHHDEDVVGYCFIRQYPTFKFQSLLDGTFMQWYNTPEPKPVEMTISEISEKFGYEIKIIKG